MIGCASDQRPSPEVIRFFNSFSPPLEWVVFSHWRGDPVRNLDSLVIADGLRVGYAESPFPAFRRSNYRDKNRLEGGWRPGHKVLWASSARNLVQDHSPATHLRMLPDLTVTGRYQGFTRIGLDGWGTRHPSNGEYTPTLTRFRNKWFNLWRSNAVSITAPGPEGAVATIRYEMLREGIQEVEARIIMERALDDAQAPEDLKTKIRTFLGERIARRYFVNGDSHIPAEENKPEADWQADTHQLFELAAETAAAIGYTSPGTAAPPVAAQPPRIWTSRVNTTLEASLIRIHHGGVDLMTPQGRLLTVPLEQLSDTDQAHIRELNR
ncbi:MAG: hypothetical protein WD490_07795 [Opitutales bacterium]